MEKTIWALRRVENMYNSNKRKSIIETGSKSSRSSQHIRLDEEKHTKKTHPRNNSFTSFKSQSKTSEKSQSMTQISFPKLKSKPPSISSMILDRKNLNSLPFAEKIYQKKEINFHNGQDFSQILKEEIYTPSDFESPLIRKNFFQMKNFDLEDKTILTTRYDNKEEQLAVGCEEGMVYIFNVHSGKTTKIGLAMGGKKEIDKKNAVTSVRWRPGDEKDFLLLTKIDGTIEFWDTKAQSLSFCRKEDNFIYSSDYNHDGMRFITAGQDAIIRVYDQNKPGTVLTSFSRLKDPSHINRIYSVKFSDSNPNLVVSGGWDETVILWDLRNDLANYIYGPLICGDSIDTKNDELLTGSWREKKQLQIWDLRNLKEVSVFNWIDRREQKAYIYSCQFEKALNRYIAAGSSGVNEIRIFDKLNKTNSSLDIKGGFEKGIYSINFGKIRNHLAFGSGDGKCGIFSIL